MALKIEIDGKTLAPIREASTEVSYSRDYVTRLARENKIVASLIGRQWFVDIESLKNYESQSLAEAEIRKAQLSEERKNEQIFHKEKEQHQSIKIQTQSAMHKRALLVASLVLCVGVFSGTVGQFLFSNQLNASSTQVASVQATQSATRVSALDENVLLLEEPLASNSPTFSRKTVSELPSGQNGILIIPSETTFDPSEVFSDEVIIVTASSGQQSAVRINTDGQTANTEVPFVVVPVKTMQN